MADSGINHIHNSIIQNVGATVTGIGCALLWLLWSNFYEKLKVDTSEIAIPLSALFIPLCMFFIHSLSGIIALIAVMALPVISYLMLVLSFSEITWQEEPSCHISAKGFLPEYLSVGCAAVLIHMVVSFVWALIPESFFDTIGGWFGLPILGGTILAIAITLCVIILSNYADIFTTYRWLLPTVIVSLTAFSFATSAGFAIASISITVAQIGYSIALYVFFARVAHVGWMGYAMGLGFMRGLAQLGILIGTLLGYRFEFSSLIETASLPTLCLVLLCVSIVPTLLLVNRESVFRYRTDEPHLQLSSNNKEQGESEITVLGDADQQKTLSEDVLVMACQKLAQGKGLSARETEVFVLFSQGRSTPYIRDVLHISKNTVDSHAKNIYRKLEVHSRQELINLVHESIRKSS